MPVYIYINPETEETIELVQSVKDKHEYIDKNGKKWNRVFTAPEINTQNKLTAFSSEKEFIETTKNKRGTIGDLWDQSKELSEKRKINKIFRQKDTSNLWPINNSFNVTERAIRRLRKFSRLSAEFTSAYEYQLALENEVSLLVNSHV